MAKKQKQPRDKEAAEGGRPVKKGSGGQEGSALAEWTKSILFAAALFFFFRTFLIQTFVITSGSMENTLLVGDFLLVNRAAIGSRIPLTDVRIPGYSSVERGDILVFDPPHEEDLKLVKRLIGVPGDTLEMRGKTLFLNGVAQEEPYVVITEYGDQFDGTMLWQREYLVGNTDPAEYRPSRDSWGPIAIPDGHYFMLGDNRDTSLDSRYWGLLEGWRLEGRAVAIYFSYEKESFKPFPWIREIRGSRIGTRIR
ncbi:MAG: signal peptidase I [Gemmatimonadota bacterium]|nr:signal peptidase I [Gemmatimonadota bacterium]